MTRRVPFAKEGKPRCTSQIENPTLGKGIMVRCGLVPHTAKESLHLSGGMMWRDKDERWHGMLCSNCQEPLTDEITWIAGTRKITESGYLVQHFNWCYSCYDIAMESLLPRWRAPWEVKNA